MQRMSRVHEVKLRASLTEVIGAWLESDEEERGMPWLGENAAEIMAEAALAVLRGMADAEEYLRREGMLDDE